MGNADQKSPAQLRAERFASLRSQWNQLSGRLTLGHLRTEIETTAGEVEALPQRITQLVSRGYRYSHDWQTRAAALNEGWPKRRREALNLLQNQARDLGNQGRESARLCDRSALSDTELDQLGHRLSQLQSALNSAESAVRAVLDSSAKQLDQLQREFQSVEFMLDSLDTASFELYPDEAGVAASEVVWANHPDEPQGILFLTNGRLILEQREKKAKKKVLFVTTESELVQQKLWESTIGNLAELAAEDQKKFLSHKELLHLSFREYTSGLHGEVTLHLKDTTNEIWASLIQFVSSGELEAGPGEVQPAAASAPAGAAAPEPPKAIPTRCPACGGQLPPLVKGMRELVCEYCSTSIRL